MERLRAARNRRSARVSRLDSYCTNHWHSVEVPLPTAVTRHGALTNATP